MTIPTLARAITLSGRRLASTSAAAPQVSTSSSPTRRGRPSPHPRARNMCCDAASSLAATVKRDADTSWPRQQALLKTPLHALHIDPAHKAKMTGFAGYDMPLSYSGPVVEGDKGAVAGGPGECFT